MKWFSPHCPRTDGAESSTAPWALRARPAHPVPGRLSVGDAQLPLRGCDLRSICEETYRVCRRRASLCLEMSGV